MIESLFLPLMLSATALTAQPDATPPPQPKSQSAPPAQEEASKITAQDRATLRCSAAFALVGARQAGRAGEEEDWSDINQRGREFFVVALADMMDKRGLDRVAIEREVRKEAQKLLQSGDVDTIMPACLLMLQASGL